MLSFIRFSKVTSIKGERLVGKKLHFYLAIEVSSYADVSSGCPHVSWELRLKLALVDRQCVKARDAN